MIKIRVFLVVIGLLLLINGIYAIYFEGFYHWNIFIETRANKYFVGGIFIGLSLFCFVLTALKRKTLELFLLGQVYKCNVCGNIYKSKFKDKLCDKCAGDIEPIEGFFERHPKFRK